MELEGMYNSLRDAGHHLNHLSHINMYCDCESGILKVDKDIYKPRHAMAPEMDVIMALKQLTKESPCEIKFLHVKGRADKNCPVNKLKKEKQMNVHVTRMQTSIPIPIYQSPNLP